MNDFKGIYNSKSNLKIYCGLWNFVIVKRLSDNALLSGYALATSVHLMNYTNTNQLIILFTSLKLLSGFVFDIIDMLSRWNNRAVSVEDSARVASSTFEKYNWKYYRSIIFHNFIKSIFFEDDSTSITIYCTSHIMTIKRNSSTNIRVF